MILSARIPEEITLGDWFDWFMQDQAKRSPKTPIEGTGSNKDSGWLFYSPKWFSYPLFIHILNPRLTAGENSVRKGQIIYIKRVFYVNDTQHEERISTSRLTGRMERSYPVNISFTAILVK